MNLTAPRVKLLAGATPWELEDRANKFLDELLQAQETVFSISLEVCQNAIPYTMLIVYGFSEYS
jgi:hypothetical protein